MGDLHTDRAFIRVKTKKPKMNFCVSGMTNRWRVSGVVINIKVFTMRVNLIKFFIPCRFFHRNCDTSTTKPFNSNVTTDSSDSQSECFRAQTIFPSFLFFFVFDNLFFHSLISSEVFFFNYFWIFLEINFSQRVLQTDWRPRDSLFNYVILHV